MNVNQKTFCSAPWFQIRQDMDGSVRSCCEIQHTDSDYRGNKTFYDVDEWLQSDYLEYIKKNLNNGIKLKECNKCWNKEQNGIPSLRTFINNTAISSRSFDQSWLPLYFKNKKDLSTDLLLSADIKTSNVCNFACAMCHPYDSSQIHAQYKKDQEHPFVQQQLSKNPDMLDHVDLIYREGGSYKLLNDILDKKPKYLKLLGGEPLLDKKLIQTLKNYPHKSKTTLIFVTNGSVDLCKTQETLQEYKTIHYVLSLEGVGKIQEYVRKGSNWDDTEKNILSFVHRYSSRNISIHHTLQALTIENFIQLLQWTEKHSISLTVGILRNPDYLSISALSEDSVNRIIKVLSKSDLKIKKQISNEIIETISMIDFVEYLKANYEFSAEKQQKLQEFLNWYDPEQKWKQSLPRLLPYLN